MEVWSSGALAYCWMLLEFLAFVPHGLRFELPFVIRATPLRLARYPQLTAAHSGGIALMLVGLPQFTSCLGVEGIS